MEKNRTTTSKAESAGWRREATLRDLLDLLDEIDKLDSAPEVKAKLRQRTIDYGQHLSKAIYFGKKKVPESDDNDTIKEFNIRMYGTYETKGQSSYEEAKNPTGYYDLEGKFIDNPRYVPSPEKHGARNPRWFPIPLKEETTVVLPPTEPIIVPPVAPVFTDSGERDSTGGVLPPYTGGGTNEGKIIPSEKSPTPVSETSKKSAKEDEDKKRNHLWWLIPVVLGTAGLTAFKGCEATKSAAPVDDGKDKDKVEVVTPTQTLSQPERDHLRYTIEKGQRMTAKQFGFGNDVDKGAEIYDQFVENIRQGKLPQAMKDLSIKYQMSKMVDDEYGLNLDQPEIAATTWLLMAESYPAIASTIHQAMTNPEIKTTSREDINLNKYLSLANMAAQKHNVDGRSNLVSTRDYGLYGATRKTGWAISFRDAKADKKMYDNIAYRALHEGKDY